jgi:hypothetical protein
MLVVTVRGSFGGGRLTVTARSVRGRRVRLRLVSHNRARTVGRLTARLTKGRWTVALSYTPVRQRAGASR